jgi:hypothetical protein
MQLKAAMNAVIIRITPTPATLFLAENAGSSCLIFSELLLILFYAPNFSSG